jgi:methionyl-tRNA synthetase
MEKYRFDKALDEAWKFITYCDQLISDKKPWELIKNGEEKQVQDLLHHLAEALRHIAIMLWPVLPETAEKIFTQLGLNVEVELSKSLTDLQQWVELTVGNKIKKDEQLFPRLEETK